MVPSNSNPCRSKGNVLWVAEFKLTFKQLHSLLRLNIEAYTAVRSATNNLGTAWRERYFKVGPTTPPLFSLMPGVIQKGLGKWPKFPYGLKPGFGALSRVGRC